MNDRVFVECTASAVSVRGTRCNTRASTTMMRRWTSGIPPSPARCSTLPTSDSCVLTLALALKMAVVRHAAVVALCHQP